MIAVHDDIERVIQGGQLDKAERTLEGLDASDETRADLLFLKGLLAEARLDWMGAHELYAQVLEIAPDHKQARFHAAFLADLHGDRESAMVAYEECTGDATAPVNALINLAVLYEEDGVYDKAEACLMRVLAEHPNHYRARFLLHSVESSRTMVVDETNQWDREHKVALHDQPLSDFELSVRSRNCLRQMNLNTIGSLLRATQADLLSHKNFGETSLNEITMLLAQKGLRLGQSLADDPGEASPSEAPAVPPTPDDSSLSIRSVSELELSVRSRKCLQRLGITTLAELVGRTEPELMTAKNFGQTSLAEIKSQLTRLGLALRSAT